MPKGRQKLLNVISASEFYSTGLPSLLHLVLKWKREFKSMEKFRGKGMLMEMNLREEGGAYFYGRKERKEWHNLKKFVLTLRRTGERENGRTGNETHGRDASPGGTRREFVILLGRTNGHTQGITEARKRCRSSAEEVLVT